MMPGHHPELEIPAHLLGLRCVQQAVMTLAYRVKPDADFQQRQQHPRYGEPWTAVEDHLVRLLWAHSVELDRIASILGRQTRSVRKHMNDVMSIQVSSPREWVLSRDGTPQGDRMTLDELGAVVFEPNQVPGYEL